ncbi:MAG: GNAT family N-acetyltransferase [Acidimicrobiales bacterium]|jgi:ribosomal protein S18 acetylase RimI-like enzyme
MKANGVLVERVSEVTDELVDVMAALLPQLSSAAVAPDSSALQEIVSSPTSSLLVARLASHPDVIVGAITVLVYRIPTGLHAVIEDVVVDESARGHGVGGALVQAAVELARGRGARHVNLTSRASRQAANRLYQRAGFEIRETNVYRLNLS